MRRTLLAATSVAILAGCPQTYAPAPTPSATTPAPPSDPSDPPPTPVGTVGAVGAPCNASADCGSGICEGLGCGDSQGVCADPNRACTKDYVAYCGCDGSTFRGSGTCPGKRFSARGSCPEGDGAGERTNVADGEACSSASECAGGICEGQGCGALAGNCRSRDRACTMDIRQYCGCDGATFQASGSCPGKLYAKRGACEQ